MLSILSLTAQLQQLVRMKFELFGFGLVCFLIFETDLASPLSQRNDLLPLLLCICLIMGTFLICTLPRSAFMHWILFIMEQWDSSSVITLKLIAAPCMLGLDGLLSTYTGLFTVIPSQW